MSAYKTYDFSIGPGGSAQIFAVGTYFRIMNCTGALSITGEFGEASPLFAGQGFKDSPFTKLQIKNLTAFANSGQIIVASEEFIDQQMVMSGTVSTQSAAMSGLSLADSVVTTSSSMVLAARANRRYLLIQNKSSNGNVWLNFGNPAVAGGGIWLQPGGVFEQSYQAFTHQLNAIGDLASNPSLLVTEGW